LRVDTPEDAAPVAEKLQQFEALKRELSLGRAVPSR
jgi:hypothetical protein